MSDKIVNIRDAVKGAKPAAAPRAKKAAGAASPSPPGDGDGFYGPPGRLPEECPVRALGRYANTFFFLDQKGQFTQLEASEISRNNIIALFGGSEYLIKTWTSFGRDGKPNGEFKHGLLSPVLIGSCNDKPLFDPRQRLRSLGTWVEEDGTLVFHCGDILHVAPLHEPPRRQGTGLRGQLLYPAAKKIPEPDLDADRDGGPYSAAGELYRMLCTWNWQRGETDAKLLFGWICAALLGAAQPWRPMVWVTGGAGCGKSLLSKLIEWVLGGEEAIIKSDNATAASIFQLVGQSSLPVVLDEVEAKANNKRTHEVVELARLAASGGKLTRGGADGVPLRFVARNCFFFSSILIPPLRPQDISRMAILALDKIEWEGAKKSAGVDPDADDEVLGRQKDWVQVGRELRAALMHEWPRYRATFAAIRHALGKVGHDTRGADQFGALGAAFDCAMDAGLDEARATSWAAMLPAAELSEIRARQATENACLSYLLDSSVDVHRGGMKLNVGEWLVKCMDAKKNHTVNDNEAERVLRGVGIKLLRDARDKERRLWWIAIANTHQEIARMFEGTDWAGDPGLRGPWAQALERIPNAMHKRLRINRRAYHLTLVPWEASGFTTAATDDDEEMVAPEDSDEMTA